VRLSVGARSRLPYHSVTAKQYCPSWSTVSRHLRDLRQSTLQHSKLRRTAILKASLAEATFVQDPFDDRYRYPVVSNM
jgi:hypothetical protein